MSALVDELLKQATILERHAFKTKCWPGDNDFEDAANPMRRAAAELTTLQSRLEAVEAERDDARRKLFPYADATEISGMSWSGFYLIGDEKSISKLRQIENDAAQIEIYRKAFEERTAAAEARVEDLQKALAEAINEAEAKGRDLRNDDATRRGAIYAAQLIRAALSPARTEEGKP
jgi:ribosomal protein S12 methylthiotransferase accessory factor YcaO